MGSLALESECDQSWNVLVTGFGPFLDNHLNPSYLITNSLPSTLSAPGLPPVNICAYSHPVEVCYRTVRSLVPKLLFQSDNVESDPLRAVQTTREDRQKFDIVLNIGLAPGRKYYSIESCAHRDNYVKKDIDGETMEGDTYWRDTYNSPLILEPSFNVPDIWRRWKQALLLTDEDVRPSSNAGRYLCEYIYYASMLESWRRDPGGIRRYMFLHVPSGTTEEDLGRGIRVVLALIAALVGSELMKGKKQTAAANVELFQASVMQEEDGA